VWAQQPSGSQTSQSPSTQQQSAPDYEMPGMQMPDAANQDGMQSMSGMTMGQPATTLIGEIEQHATSGTSADPNSTPMPMLMAMKGSWMFMFHSVVFLNLQQQSGPRGADKVFSTNWLCQWRNASWGRVRSPRAPC